MLNKTKVLLIVVFFVSVVCFVSVFRYEQITSSIVKAQTDSARLSLELSKFQESYLKAEPISFNLRLSNQTTQPISMKGSLRNAANINFLVTNAAGVESRLNGNQYMTGDFYISLKVMQPGERAEESSLLERYLVEKLFSSPGRYDLQIEFVYDTNVPDEEKTKVLSNSISINILEPQGIDRQAYQYIKGTLDASRRNSNNRVIAQLEQEFVDRYRNSVYAKYIIFNLANTYQAMGDDEKALRELCKVSGENFHYSKQIEKEVLRIDRKLHPIDWATLPENAPDPIIKHPCTGRIMN